MAKKAHWYALLHLADRIEWLYLGQQPNEEFARIMLANKLHQPQLPGFILVEKKHWPYRAWIAVDSIWMITFSEGPDFNAP